MTRFQYDYQGITSGIALGFPVFPEIKIYRDLAREPISNRGIKRNNQTWGGHAWLFL
jgi:hypothetical protein